MMQECVFCRIVRGELPPMKVYEDDYTLAFMDNAGDVDGHMLVIPKVHCESVLDCDAETARRVMDTVKRVSGHLVQNCGYEGVDLMSANGKAAGQTMFHWHIHIIPRKTGDGLGGSGQWPSFPGAKCAIEDMHAKLKMM